MCLGGCPGRVEGCVAADGDGVDIVEAVVEVVGRVDDADVGPSHEEKRALKMGASQTYIQGAT